MVTWPREWCRMNEPAQKVCAVYRIRLVKTKNKPISVSRFLGSDKEGVLCIGRASNMQNRRTQFVSGSKGHSEGRLLCFLRKYSGLQRKYPRVPLEYQYVTTGSVRESKRQEEELIKKYVREYGEVPPLNSTIPGRERSDSWQK